ncbi:hypothetical protein N9L76_02410 [bacterium]|nr:hypothetical protein [bacterium]|tara:strand:+ start:2317 stop:2592 length:276 start_codon:yes stop_codon:yes gene_type:complete
MQALKKLLGVAVAVELASVAGTYVAFHKLNTDPEFRSWADQNCPYVLDGFCTAVEAVGHELPKDLRERQRSKVKAAVKTKNDNAPGSKRVE